MTSEPRTLGAPADWRSEVESVRRMVDGLRDERNALRAACEAALPFIDPRTTTRDGRNVAEVLAAALAGEVAHVG